MTNGCTQRFWNKQGSWILKVIVKTASHQMLQKIWMETTCSRSFIAFCGGKQWKLASAFTFLWRNPLIGFHSIKFHFEFCVKSFKHSYNNLTIKTKYSLLEEANFHFIKSTKLSLSQEKCKNFHWKMLHHSLSEQIKQLSLAQKKETTFF